MATLGQLEGGGRAGPYDGKGTTPQGLLLRGDDTGNTERSTYVSRRIAVSTSRMDNDMVGTTQPRRPMDVTSTTPSPTGRPLAAMKSLRGPSARCNRGWTNGGREADTPEVNEPADIRYPHHAKRWKLGVGRTPGDLTTEGVFAMGKDKTAIVFKTGQLICPFRGHQQRTRPRQPQNQAWAHNGIREGTPGCLYINAYNN